MFAPLPTSTKSWVAWLRVRLHWLEALAASLAQIGSRLLVCAGRPEEAAGTPPANGGSPTKISCRKNVGTLILTSLPEDLVEDARSNMDRSGVKWSNPPSKATTGPEQNFPGPHWLGSLAQA